MISPKQFGFQSGISTCDALLSLTEDIYSALDDKQHFIAAIIDVKKAFDCVNHSILLSKLEKYGVRGIPLSWLTSYTWLIENAMLNLVPLNQIQIP